ncbi:MAG: hypothetical protein HC933_04450 [Pleurocapsa sp. SU_196_0]|nr:hypothetical protein [Pleurocapsa sp. SU_196_0]
MPDRDNLSKTLKKPWSGAVNAARQGPEILAQFAAAATTSVIADMGNGVLLENLVTQLVEVSTRAAPDQMSAVLRIPENGECSRESLVAIKAAERVLVEIITGSPVNPAEIRTKHLSMRTAKKFQKSMCLGIIAVKVPDLYTTPEIALRELNACEQVLKTLLQNTARELEENPTNPKITKLKKPRRKRRKSQEELVGSTPKMNLGNL